MVNEWEVESVEVHQILKKYTEALQPHNPRCIGRRIVIRLRKELEGRQPDDAQHASFSEAQTAHVAFKIHEGTSVHDLGCLFANVTDRLKRIELPIIVADDGKISEEELKRMSRPGKTWRKRGGRG